MNSEKVKQFQILNQSTLALKHIVCSECNNWLLGNIYIHPDEKNYCFMCSAQEEIGRRRNTTLEFMLKNVLFLCPHDDCDFILRADQVEEHADNCVYAPYDCIICDKKNFSLMNYQEHLKAKHSDNTIKLDKPVLQLTLAQPKMDNIYIALLNSHIFLIHVYREGDKLLVNVGKIFNMYDKNVCNMFKAYCKSDDVDQIIKKQFVMCSEVGETDLDSLFQLNDPKTQNLEIILCDYDIAPPLAECPICQHELGLKVRQCSNGHNTCMTCGSKIGTCAICRITTFYNLNLKFLFSHSSILCSNFDKGCLAVGHSDVIDEHVKTCCYNTVVCHICNEQCLVCSMAMHMKDKHKLFKNFDNLHLEVKDTTAFSFQECLGFKNQTFCFKWATAGAGDIMKILLTVQLLGSTLLEAQKYRYEVHILGNDDDIAHLLRGVCQTTADLTSSCSIYYDLCAKSFQTVNNLVRMRYRYLIVEVGDNL